MDQQLNILFSSPQYRISIVSRVQSYHGVKLQAFTNFFAKVSKHYFAKLYCQTFLLYGTVH